MVMKTILVPTDFSPVSNNATQYAVSMALSLKADILLLHMYEIPIAVTDTPLMLLSVDELKDNAEKKLLEKKRELEAQTNGHLSIHTEALLGTVTDGLDEVAGKTDVLAVIMGSTGSSAVERTLFGSNTLTAIRHLNVPVICVPDGSTWSGGITQIGLAADFRDAQDTLPSAAIHEWVNKLNARLHVLNVDHNNKQFESDTPEQTALLYSALEDLKPQYHFIENADIQAGIHDFAERNNLDLIVAIPKKHRFLDGLFHKSQVKQLVLGAQVPVMCLHPGS
jgi:nucleotide-binding universal stress UspA family protein